MRGEAPPAGSRLAERYVVLDTLGVGSMGVVLAAYDPDLDRKIALKLVRMRAGQNKQARLRREAQALARLNHPNVVSVHDVGVHEAQLFISMEFIEGQTLREWLLRAPERPWRELLGVYLGAGRGLAAVHAVGLVHRDFKPDNVMIGADGRVRVTDLGLARADEGASSEEPLALAATKEQQAGTLQQLVGDPQQLVGTPLTQTGTLLGTPAYMSPEQFSRSRVDERSDQFSFCVALYEGLYQQRPFDGDSFYDLMVAVVCGKLRAPPPGSAIPPRVYRILARGLETDPGARWPSMHELLDALEELAEEPARRRRRLGLALALTSALAGGAGALSMATREEPRACAGGREQLRGVWDATRRAEVQRAFAATELSFATEAWRNTSRALDDYAQQWSEARREACEATRAGAQSERLLDTRMLCLDRRLAELRATVELLVEPDERVLERATELASELSRLDRCSDAAALLADVPPPEDAELAAQVSALRLELAQVDALTRAGRYREGLVIAEQLDARASTLDYEPLRVWIWQHLGVLQHALGDKQRARVNLERTYDSALALDMTREAAKAGTVLIRAVIHTPSETAGGRAWARHTEPLLRAAGSREDYAKFHHNLGRLEHGAGNYAEATVHLRRACAALEQAFGPDDPRLTKSLSLLGFIALYEGRYADARAHVERALVITEATRGAAHPGMGNTLTLLGAIEQRHGEYARALGHYERAHAVYEAAYGPTHTMSLTGLNNLAGAAYLNDDEQTALRHFERILGLYRAGEAPEHEAVASAMHGLSVARSSAGDLAGARSLLEESLAMRERLYGPDHPSHVNTLLGLGKTLTQLGHPHEGRAHIERALASLDANAAASFAIVHAQLTLLDALWVSDSTAERARAIELAEALEETLREAEDIPPKKLADVRARLDRWQRERARAPSR